MGKIVSVVVIGGIEWRSGPNMILKCNKCKGNNVLQQASILIDWRDMDEPDFCIELGDLSFDDYYYCKDCEMDVHATEVEMESE